MSTKYRTFAIFNPPVAQPDPLFPTAGRSHRPPAPEALGPIFGTTWGADDQIIFGTVGGLYRVSGGGGDAEPLTTPDTEQGERGHGWPSLIPDREAVVFVIAGTGGGSALTDGQLAVLDLATRAVTRLGLAGVSPRYLPIGHLVYAAEDGSVRAVPFDAASLTLTGSPVPLVEGVMVNPAGAANFSVSDTGSLAYVPSRSASSDRTLAVVGRNGVAEPLNVPPAPYLSPGRALRRRLLLPHNRPALRRDR